MTYHCRLQCYAVASHLIQRRAVVGAGFSRRGRTVVRLRGNEPQPEDLRLSARAPAEAGAYIAPTKFEQFVNILAAKTPAVGLNQYRAAAADRRGTRRLRGKHLG